MDLIEEYLAETENAVRAISRADVRAVVDRLEGVWRARGTMFLIGNGGSASTASHLMNDLCKCTRVPGSLPVRSVALTDNVPLMTAYANDVEYRKIFTAQLENFIRPGDALIAVSGSGNSPNVIDACEYARSAGATVIGLCGDPGGRLAEIADERVVIPARRINQQEDGHLIVGHILALALRERVESAYRNVATTVVDDQAIAAVPA